MVFLNMFVGKMRLFAGVVAILSSAIWSADARADLIININEVGSDLVLQGSGSVNTAGLTFANLTSSWVNPGLGNRFVQVGTGRFSVWNNFVGPANFGPGPGLPLTPNRTGDPFGLDLSRTPTRLFLPENYVSGTQLAGTATFNNTTFASLGLTTGSYQFSWGSGLNADTMTVNIGVTAVPEPSSLLLLIIAAPVIVCIRRRYRK